MKTIISPDKQTYSILSFSNFDSSFFFKSKIKKRLECLKNILMEITKEIIKVIYVSYIGRQASLISRRWKKNVSNLHGIMVIWGK